VIDDPDEQPLKPANEIAHRRTETVRASTYVVVSAPSPESSGE
jgi:hypothetical protein